MGTFLVRVAKSKKKTPNEYYVLTTVFMKKAISTEVQVDSEGHVLLEGKVRDALGRLSPCLLTHSTCCDALNTSHQLRSISPPSCGSPLLQ